MNFQAINQIKGQKDEKGYPQKLDMSAILNELRGTHYNANGTLCHECVITDMSNEKHKVTLFKDVPAANLLNTQQVFSLYAYEGTYTDKQTGQMRSYTGYSGFWVANPQRHQNTPQMHQNIPQSTNVPPQGNLDTQIMTLATRIVECIENIARKTMAERFQDAYNLPSEDDNQEGNSKYDQIPI